VIAFMLKLSIAHVPIFLAIFGTAFSAATFFSPSLAVAGSSSLPISSNHRLWDNGADIRVLQQFLNAHRYLVASSGPGSPGEETTLFGLHTYRALVQFQAAEGLPTTGFLGPLTRGAIALLTASISMATSSTATSSTATPTATVASSTPVTTSSAPALAFGVAQPAPLPADYTPGYGGGGPAPTPPAAPVISSIASSTVTASAATITWTTDENANSQIDYGTTAAYGATTTLNSVLTISHSVALSGLSAATVYHFQVRSTDAYGNLTVSTDQIFMTPPTLATLPFAAGALVSAIGDSIIGYNNEVDTASPGADAYSYGEVQWAWAIDPRFDFDTWYDTSDPSGRNISGANNGVFGDHLVGPGTGSTPGILNRLPTVLSHHPDILIFEGGTNSISSGDDGTGNPATASYVEGEIDAALTEAREAGVWIVLTTLRPRGDWPAGDPRYATLAAVNTWIRAQSGRDGVYAIWDPYSVYVDGNGNQIVSLFQSDLVHQDTEGAQLSGAVLLPILQNMISSGSTFDQNPLDTNLDSNNGMTGTTGTKGTNATGTVATGFMLAIGRGNSTVVGSKQVISSTTEKQIITITPVSGGASTAYHSVILTMPQVLSSGLFADGDWLQAGCYMEVGTTTSIGNARLNLQIDQVSTIRTQDYGMNAFSPTFSSSTEPNMAYWIVTPPLQATSTFDRAKWSLEIDFSQNATDTPVVKVSSCFMRKISNPQTVWGF
jgi:hypothetical protein